LGKNDQFFDKFCSIFQYTAKSPNYSGDATKLFGGVYPPQVCFYWLQVVEKMKELNLIIEDWLCVMQKLRG